MNASIIFLILLGLMLTGMPISISLGLTVLKGAGTLVADPRGQVALCPFGNPGMASAGMGDLLTGVIAGLLAQGMSPWDSACLGVLAHAVSGDRAAQGRPRGLLASDLLLPLRDCVNGAVACAHE